MIIVSSKILKSIRWIILDLSGVRFLWEKFLPPINSEGIRKPSTIIFWIVGTYVAFFGVASQRYENRIDLIEYRISSTFSQLSTEAKKIALARIPSLQKMTAPVKPEILAPGSVWKSLFGKEIIYNDGVEVLKELLTGLRKSLVVIDLSGVNLEGTDLRGFGFEQSNLSNANLKYVDIEGSNVGGVILENSDFTGANCKNTSFGRAQLKGANFTNANLTGAVFAYSDAVEANFTSAIINDARFDYTDLTNAEGLTFSQLSRSKSLYEVKGLDEQLKKMLIESNSYLFEESSRNN